MRYLTFRYLTNSKAKLLKFMFARQIKLTINTSALIKEIFNINIVMISALLSGVEMRVNLTESRVEQLTRNNAGILTSHVLCC